MSYLKNNRVLLLIIAVLIATNLFVLYSQVWNKPHPARRSMKEVMMNKLENEVGFSKEQLAEYDSMRTNHFKSMEPMFDELRKAKVNFFKLISQPEITDSIISNYASAISHNQEAIDSKMLRYFRSLKNIATPEQGPKMDTLLLNITKQMAGGGPRGQKPNNPKK